MDTLTGSVERITFYNPENGYTVLRPENQKGIHAIPKSSLSFDGLATVVGNLPELSQANTCNCKESATNTEHMVHNSKQTCANKPL